MYIALWCEQLEIIETELNTDSDEVLMGEQMPLDDDLVEYLLEAEQLLAQIVLGL